MNSAAGMNANTGKKTSKRRKSSTRRAQDDELTGGTMDVNPQYLHGTVTMSAANTTTTVALGTPIVRVGPQTDGNAVIMEVLKCYADMTVVDTDNAAATTRTHTISFATTNFGATAPTAGFAEPRVFAQMQRQVRNAFTAAGSGMLDQLDDVAVYDCTDGAGHGILIATDNIFVQGSSANFNAAVAFPFKILYRFKRVSLVEYIGIVQSQQ